MNRLEALAALHGEEHRALQESPFFGAIVNAAVILSATLTDHGAECEVQYSASAERIAIVVGAPTKKEAQHPVQEVARGEGAQTLPPYQQRVIEEQHELANKLEKLHAFIDSEMFGTLPDMERVRLSEQATAMESYLALLKQRVAAFAEQEGERAIDRKADAEERDERPNDGNI